MNNIIGLIYLLYFFYYTFRQIHNNYVMSKLKHVCPSAQFNRSVMSDSLQPLGLQHARPPCPSPTPRVYSNYVHWVSDTIQPSQPLSPPSPIVNLSQHPGLFQWVSSSHQVAEVSVLPRNIQDWFSLRLTVPWGRARARGRALTPRAHPGAARDRLRREIRWRNVSI